MREKKTNSTLNYLFIELIILFSMLSFSIEFLISFVTDF